LNIFKSFLGLGAHLFVEVPRPGDSEVTFLVFELSCHLLLPVQPLKCRDNPFKCLAHAVQAHNKRTCRSIFTLTILNTECQVGKLWIPTFRIFWSDSAREWNPGLQTTKRKL